jgi:hypothetical protein
MGPYQGELPTHGLFRGRMPATISASNVSIPESREMVGKSQRERNDHQRGVGEARCGEGRRARDEQAANAERLAIGVETV